MTKLLLRLRLLMSRNRAKQWRWLAFLTSFTAWMVILIHPGLASPGSALATTPAAPHSVIVDSTKSLPTDALVNAANPEQPARPNAASPYPTVPHLVYPSACLEQSRPMTLSLPAAAAAEITPEESAMLQESWLAYRDRFIQGDGRVIDREDNDRTVSEGQAYAMLRAVMINDPDTFERTFIWAEYNLRRKDEAGEPRDSLWAWKWGQHSSGSWRILDENFASDADLDAAYALILAARRWNCSQYLDIAKIKLNDLWELSTGTIRHRQYFIPGPKEVFWNDTDGYLLNPSYFAPYAFRLFAQVDSAHPWMRLVNSSYDALAEDAALSDVGLPNDWVAVNPRNGRFRPLPASRSMNTQYGFDAYRVWWRVAWDAAWFQERRANRFLHRNLSYLDKLWRTEQQIPAQIDLTGRAIADYESTSQYAMLHYAFSQVNPEVAEQIYQQKLLPVYDNGIWDSDTAYYTQNLAWFGLLPATPPREFSLTEARFPRWFPFRFLSFVIRSETAS